MEVEEREGGTSNPMAGFYRLRFSPPCSLLFLLFLIWLIMFVFSILCNLIMGCAFSRLLFHRLSMRSRGGEVKFKVQSLT